jgi:hypothetical protein
MDKLSIDIKRLSSKGLAIRYTLVEKSNKQKHQSVKLIRRLRK